MTVEEETAPPPPQFETLSILRLIKEAQQKHGLRHGDYMAYRCAQDGHLELTFLLPIVYANFLNCARRTMRDTDVLSIVNCWVALHLNVSDLTLLH